MSEPTIPFPGLRPFSQEESEFYYGREEQQRELFQQLYSRNFIAVTGISGCGKSSLVRAGILPYLKRGFAVPENSCWKIVTLTPGDDPARNLAEALHQSLILDDAANRDAQNEKRAEVNTDIGHTSLSEELLKQFSESTRTTKNRLLIFVDQFEELFQAYSGEKKHLAQSIRFPNQGMRSFVETVLSAAKDESESIHVLLTIRSDFVGHCAGFYGLAEAVNESMYLVPGLTQAQLRRSIVRPIQDQGQDISPTLVNEFVKGYCEGRIELPILQHTLMRIWRSSSWKPNSNSGRIELKNYDEVRGLSEGETDSLHTIDKHLQDLFNESDFNLRKQHIAQVIFRKLTRFTESGDPSRIQATISEIAVFAQIDEDEVMDVVDHLRKDGISFLTSYPISHSQKDAQAALSTNTPVTLTHESVARYSVRYVRKWMELEAESQRVFGRIRDEHKEYQEVSWLNPWRKYQMLLTGLSKTLLKQGREDESENLGQLNRDLLSTDAAAFVKQQTRTQRVTLLVVGLVLALGLIPRELEQFNSARAQMVQQRQALDEYESEVDRLKYRLSVRDDEIYLTNVLLDRNSDELSAVRGILSDRSLDNEERVTRLSKQLGFTVHLLGENYVRKLWAKVYADPNEVSEVERNAAFRELIAFNEPDAVIALEPLQEYQFGDRQSITITNFDGEDARLSSLDLSFVNFARQNFESADLSLTNCIFTNFRETDFSGAEFSNANLAYADFDKANLEKANFSQADLTRANFHGANLSGVQGFRRARSLEDMVLIEIDGVPAGFKGSEDFVTFAKSKGAIVNEPFVRKNWENIAREKAWALRPSKEASYKSNYSLEALAAYTVQIYYDSTNFKSASDAIRIRGRLLAADQFSGKVRLNPHSRETLFRLAGPEKYKIRYGSPDDANAADVLLEFCKNEFNADANQVKKSEGDFMNLLDSKSIVLSIGKTIKSQRARK